MSALFESWLTEATRELAEESAARVRAEIAEHYGSAIASGVSDEEAIAALGDARQANRAYRKVLLTRADAKWLERLKHRAEIPLFGAYVMAFAGLVGGAAKILQGKPYGALPALSIMVIGSLLLVPRWVSIHTRLRNRMYRAWQWAAFIGVPVALATTGRFRPVFFIYLVFVCAAYKNYLLRRKLPVEEWPKELYL